MEYDATIRLRQMITRRMTVLADEGGVIAGLLSVGSAEYVVLAGMLDDGTLLSLMIADKLFPCMGDQVQLLDILNRLNGDSLSGVHQLEAYPHGVIYCYKQLLRLQGELDDKLFDQLLTDGISEFSRGVKGICKGLAEAMGAKWESDESKLATGWN